MNIKIKVVKKRGEAIKCVGTHFMEKKCKKIDISYLYEYEISKERRGELEKLIDSSHSNERKAARKMLGVPTPCHQTKKTGTGLDMFAPIEEQINVGVFFLGHFMANLKEVIVKYPSGRIVKIHGRTFPNFGNVNTKKEVQRIIRKRFMILSKKPM